jgi:hypothetical protein
MQIKGYFFLIVTLAFLSVGSTVGQTKSGPTFDTQDFAQKAELAKWLVIYDEVAWHTSDVAMAEDKAEVAKLGQEWFCFQDARKTWHAVYGKLTDHGYDAVFHYTLDATGKINRTSEKIDQGFLNAHTRALAVSRSKLKAIISNGSPLFNQYIRKEDDSSLSVWLLPAFQTDGTAVYGGEAFYKLDPTGTKVLKEETYFLPNYHGFKTSPAREIWLDYPEVEKPTLGSVFFVWYYKSYFTNIFINNTKSTSTVIKADNDYMWLNIEKDDKKKTTEKQKS